MSGSLFSDNNNKWRLGIAWLLWSVLYAWVLYSYGVSTTVAILDSAISNGLMLACVWVAANTMQFYLPANGQLSYVAGLTAITALVWFFATKSLLLLLPGSGADYNVFWNKAVTIRLAGGIMIALCSNLLSMLWQNMKQLKEEGAKANRITDLARQTELMKLRQQLQPHFLFNSLNSINALIGIDPAKARHMIHQLSAFFRNSIAAEQKDKHSLEQELKHIELYLDIEKVRFGDRLQVVFDVPEAIRHLDVPVLLLQPVMENAIKYGLYDTTGTVLITLSAARQDQHLVITLTNPYDAATNRQRQGTGFGLSSVSQRLFLIYGRQGLLQTHAEGELFTITITIPQHEQSHNN